MSVHFVKQFFGERLVESRVDLFQVALSVGRRDRAWFARVNDSHLYRIARTHTQRVFCSHLIISSVLKGSISLLLKSGLKQV